MKRAINISFFGLFVVAVIGLMGFIYIEQGKLPINEIIINISHEGEKGFLDNDNILATVINYDSITYKKANQINTAVLESSINKNPFVKKVDAFINIDKNLIINIEEKQAFLRIYNRKNKGFYIDRTGYIFPLNEDYTPKVIIANGYIDALPILNKDNVFDSAYHHTQLPNLFILAKLISKNEFLNAQIGQIYVNSRGEIDLVPQLGIHLIKFGTIADAAAKLDNLDVFYKKALIREGWEKYETINLKYKNQVVCKRK